MNWRRLLYHNLLRMSPVKKVKIEDKRRGVIEVAVKDCVLVGEWSNEVYSKRLIFQGDLVGRNGDEITLLTQNNAVAKCLASKARKLVWRW